MKEKFKNPLQVISICLFMTLKGGASIRTIGLFVVLMVCLLAGCQSGKIKPTIKPFVPIVVSPSASSTERIAAGELAAGLAKTYPAYRFNVTEEEPSAGPLIRLGCRDRWPMLSEDLAARLEGPESYVVSREFVDGRTVGQIIGEDPAGAAYGAYELLKRLGHGLYLSFETQPEPHNIFDFEDWDLADRPLCRRRFVLNWHNFLSGCSTWNVEDWKLWTTRLQKLGYNGVMVHAYGNNPMAGFTFRGVQKPVGYLSSTQVGRDWSTNHVADVRNLYGGELFDTPVFGSIASVDGSNRYRTEAAQKMMAKSFEHAQRRGVDVYFALDVGTASANPQELIGLLSESARFQIKPRAFGQEIAEDEPFWLADPDTEEGYEFYKAQIEHLMKVYPQIDVLALWVRMQSTPWMGLELSELPPKWRKEYEQELARTPEAAKMWRSVGLFGVSKIARAVQRALTELERDDVKVGLGSWCFDYCPAADRFLPPDVELFPLDYRVLEGKSLLGTAERRKEIAPICNNRPVWPIVWAQHDDGHYVGPPYMPKDEFYGALQDAGVEGFGVIHWLNRPMDIYFESLARQTWKGTVDEPLATTCLRVATKMFGPGEAERMGEYLLDWIGNAPRIARETRDYFIDHELPAPAEIEPGIRSRLEMLESVDLNEASFGVRAQVQYFQGLENFLLNVHRCESLYHKALKEKNDGRIDEARRTMALAHPEQVIEAFARTNKLLNPTSGDLGLIVSMNTRWLTHYIALKQELGIESIYYDFSPTSHDPLAQVAGRFTFRFEPSHKVWQCYGEHETGARVWSTEAADLPEIYRSGLVTNKLLTLNFQAMMSDVVDGDWDDATFPAGNYRMKLMFLEPAHETAGQRSFDVVLHVGDKDEEIVRSFDPFHEAGGRNRPWTIQHDFHIDVPGPVSITLTPLNGEVIICGAVLEPVIS